RVDRHSRSRTAVRTLLVRARGNSALKTYFALFLIATIASLVTTPLIRRLCQRLKLLDVPLDGRRIHRTAIPRLGGVALYLSCLAALSLLPFVDHLLPETLRD